MRLFTRGLSLWGNFPTLMSPFPPPLWHILNKSPKSINCLEILMHFKLYFWSNFAALRVNSSLLLHLARLRLLGLSVNMKQSGCSSSSSRSHSGWHFIAPLAWSCSSTRLSYVCVCREQDNNSRDRVEEAHPHERSSSVLLTKFARVRKSLKGLCCLEPWPPVNTRKRE